MADRPPPSAHIGSHPPLLTGVFDGWPLRLSVTYCFIFLYVSNSGIATNFLREQHCFILLVEGSNRMGKLSKYVEGASCKNMLSTLAFYHVSWEKVSADAEKAQPCAF